MHIRHLLLTLLLLPPCLGFGWSDTSSMAVMQICKDQLIASGSQKVVNWSENILDPLKEALPRSSEFITSICWLNDFVPIGLCALKACGGTLKPYDPKGLLKPEEKKCLQVTVLKFSSQDLICQSTAKFLGSPKGITWDQSCLFRSFFAAIADLHHPLHCIERYDTAYPEGDLGGHKVNVDIKKWGYANLHTFWDHACDPDQIKVERPLNQTERKKIEAYAKGIAEEFPIDQLSALANNLNYNAWAEESYRLAIDFVYSIPLKQLEEPSEYIKLVKRVGRMQIALAGYRLANVLKRIYETLHKEPLSFCFKKKNQPAVSLPEKKELLDEEKHLALQVAAMPRLMLETVALLGKGEGGLPLFFYRGDTTHKDAIVHIYRQKDEPDVNECAQIETLLSSTSYSSLTSKQKKLVQKWLQNYAAQLPLYKEIFSIRGAI